MGSPRTTTLTGTATCVARTGVTDDGVVVDAQTLIARVGWLAALCQEITSAIVTARWNRGDLATLAGGVDSQGRPLPEKGSVVARRLKWGVQTPAGTYVFDRVRRMAEDHAIRLLRAAVIRGQQIQVIVDTWPVDPNRRTDEEWTALRTAARTAGIDLSKVVVRNRTRNLATFLADHGRLPSGVTEAETPPRVAPMLLLAAADRKLVTLTRTSHVRAELRVRLPLCARPESRTDWAPVTVPFTIGDHVRPDATLCTPTLRIVTTAQPDGGSTRQIRVDLPHKTPVPTPVKAGSHIRAVGFDWGVNTAFTGAAATIDAGSSGTAAVVRTDGRPVFHSGAGILAKLHRLRRRTEQLNTQIAELDALLAGVPVPKKLPEAMLSKRNLRVAELAAVSARRTHLGRAFAWNVAGWAVAYAHAQHASVIYVEDLATLEHAGLGRAQNRRVSAAMRGQIMAALRHLGARTGIAVVTVPAKDTSASCPRCLSPHRHVKAPNDTRTGHAWAVCACGHSADRDHSAAERIVSRGLAGQNHTYTEKATGTSHIRNTVDVGVRLTRTRRRPARRPSPRPTRQVVTRRPARSRTKTGPTPHRPRRPAPQTGQARLTDLAASALPRVQRPDAPTPSSRPSQGGPQCGVLTKLSPAARRRRRVQARGFPGVSYPTWIRPRHPACIEPHRV